MTNAGEKQGYLRDPYVDAFPETADFWAAAEEGVLLLPVCGRCTQCHWPPRSMCPCCGAGDVERVRASGAATLYSYSIDRKNPGQPVVAYVQLDEGPLLMTNIAGMEREALRIGLRLRVSFRPAPEGRRIPVFSPS